MGDPEKIWVVFEEHANPKDKRPYVYASSSPTKGKPYVPESLAIATLPSPEDAGVREFVESLSDTVEIARKHNLPDEYVALLRGVSTAMTENLLTKEPTT